MSVDYRAVAQSVYEEMGYPSDGGPGEEVLRSIMSPHVMEAEAIGWAKHEAWNRYGIAWHHLEQKSRDELLEVARNQLRNLEGRK